MNPNSPRRERSDSRTQASSAEIAEWTRLFKIADADASGNIDRNELRQLMNMLRQNEPGQVQADPVSDQEMQAIVGVMDADNDGQISLPEFIESMTQFSLQVSSLTGTRNDATFDDSSSTSAKIGSSITNFFQRFQVMDDPQMADRWLPRILKRLRREESGGGDDAEDIDIFWLTGRAPVVVSSADDKVGGLHQFAQMMVTQTLLGEWVQHLRQNQDMAVVDQVLTCILRIVSIVEWFPTTADKVDVVPFIKWIFMYVHDTNILGTLCQRCFTMDSNLDMELMASLAIHALEIMYHYIPGPGLSTLLSNDEWRYEKRRTKIQVEQCQLLMFIPQISQMYIQQYRNGRLFGVRVVEYALRVLGCYASSNPDDRLTVACQPLPALNNNTLLDFLISLIIPQQAPHVISGVTWALAIICGETHATDPHEIPIQNLNATLFEVLTQKSVLQKLHYLMGSMKNALQQNTVPDCFDPQFLQICFDDTQLLNMERNPTKSLQQMVRLRTEVISNICCAFFHLIPGFWQQGEYLKSQDGQAFIQNIQWFLGSSLEELKRLPPTAPENESKTEVQMHAAHLRVVHMTIGCIKRIVMSTQNGTALQFEMLPACLLTMLQLRRFTTLNAAGADTVNVVVANSSLLDKVVMHNSFIDTLKGYLDDSEMQTRISAVFRMLAQHSSGKPNVLSVIKQSHVIKHLFNSLSNFRSQSSSVSKVMNYQGGDTFNIPLATNLIMAATFFCNATGQQHDPFPLVDSFGRNELQQLNELFKTIVSEMTGNKDMLRWSGVQKDEGSAGFLYVQCKKFCNDVAIKFKPYAQQQQYAQKASEVMNLAQTLYRKFNALEIGNYQEIQNLMQMEGTSGVGGLSGNGGMVDPDGRMAQRLQQNIKNNPNYVEGTGTPIEVMGTVRLAAQTQRGDFSPIGRIGQNLPYRMLKFWLINNPRASLQFSPDQLCYQIEDPRTRQPETKVIDGDQGWQRCLREVVQRAPNRPVLKLIVVQPASGGGRYGMLNVRDWQKAVQMFMQDQGVPHVAKKQHKVAEIAKELAKFCQRSGVQRLALSSNVLVQFLQNRGIGAHAQHLARAMDKNNDGQCDFKEIVIGIVNYANPEVRSKAKLMFDSFDLDKGGTLDFNEVSLFSFPHFVIILHTCFLLR